MNKKLLSLAVAAAVAAPTAAMAEAVLYGKLNQSIDYADIKNISGVEYSTVDSFNVTGTSSQTTTQIYSTAAAAQANGGPGSTGYVATAANVPTWSNYTGGTVYVPVEQPDGTLQVQAVANGQFLDGVTNTNAVSVPTGQPITLIRVNSAGVPIVDRNLGKDFKGWGVSANSYRKYTLVNPGTGLGNYYGGTHINDRANRIGVKGSEDLGNGLKAIYQVEFGISLSSADDNIVSGDNGISMRNSFVGLASDYGTVLVGRHDTPLKISTGKLDLFSDTMADYNGTVGFDDVRADNVVAYISPTYSGLSFMGAVVAGGGATAGYGLNYDNDSLASAYSLALIYNNGPFYGSAAYEVISNENFMDSAVSDAGNAQCLNADGTSTLGCAYVDEDYNKWRLGLGLLDWNGFTLTAVYEQQNDLPGGQTRTATGFIDPDGNVTFAGVSGIKKQQLWQVQAGYSFGNNMIKAMYGSVNRDAGKALANLRSETVAINNIGGLASGLRKDLEGDRSTWAVGFDHNFSKRTSVYALYTAVDDDFNGNPLYPGVDWSGFSLGVIHAF
ncbi:MAG: porin [Thiohalocapsa sp.]|jgi:predicted porin|uniref:porin n=1 Tax=Thiohalocapsa sp. TaxID=2497641 RepID=UPI0025E0692E|nr:porin [Thiohalocapsa sp.]MCG6942290.1 porin [Thiohalocapsa sp.]